MKEWGGPPSELRSGKVSLVKEWGGSSNEGVGWFP